MAIELASAQMAAPRTYLNDDKFMAVWPRMDPIIKRELLRAEREILSGIAILKDRSVGRPKKDVTGHYGLELAEAEVYRLEGVPRQAAELEKARKRAAELRAALAAEAEEVERKMRLAEELEPFHQYAAAQGLTLEQYIRKCREIELAVSRDFVEGLFMIGEWIGFDPIQLLQAVHNAPDNRQVAH